MNSYIVTSIIVIAIIFLIYLLIKVNRKVRLKAYELFLKAEHEFISGHGENKMDYVLENIYSYLPTTIRIFISSNMLRSLVQEMFNEIKDLLDDGKRNKSTKGK